MSDLFPEDPIALQERRAAVLRGAEDALAAADEGAPLIGSDAWGAGPRGAASAGFALPEAGATVAYRVSDAINDAVHAITGWDPDPEENLLAAEQRLSDALREQRLRLAPDPHESSMAGEIMFGLGELGGIAAAGGPSVGLRAVLMAGGTGIPTAHDFIAEGMDPETAWTAGAIEGVSMAALSAAPVAFPSSASSLWRRLLERGATGAGINAGLGVGYRAAMSQYLASRGYEQEAARYEALDAQALIADGVLGAAFGAGFGSRGRRVNVAPETLDAAMVTQDAYHANVTTAPGVPLDMEAQATHGRNMGRAEAAARDGEPLPAPETGGRYAPPPEAPRGDAEAAMRDMLDRAGFGELAREVETLRAEVQRRGGQLSESDKLYSAREAPAPDAAPFSSAADLRRRGQSLFGLDWAALERAGRLRVVERPADVRTGDLFRAPDNAQAVHVRDENVTYLIASNIKPKELLGVALHEIGAHNGMRRMLGAHGFREAIRQVNAAALARDAAPEVRAARAIAERRAAKPKHIDEETLAYLIALRADAPIVRSVLASLRQWALRTFGSTFGARLTMEDLSAMALAGLRRAGREARRELSKIERSALADTPPLAAVLADHPNMLIRTPLGDRPAREVLARAEAERARAMEMRKGYEAAVRCAISHGARMGDVAAPLVIGQAAGAAAALPIAYGVSHLARSGDQRFWDSEDFVRHERAAARQQRRPAVHDAGRYAEVMGEETAPIDGAPGVRPKDMESARFHGHAREIWGVDDYPNWSAPGRRETEPGDLEARYDANVAATGKRPFEPPSAPPEAPEGDQTERLIELFAPVIAAQDGRDAQQQTTRPVIPRLEERK